MSLKLDMAKVYHHMVWDFLKNVQVYLKVSFSILIIGSPFGNVEPSWGLRKGDPLSLYLFVLGADVLSQMLIEAKEEGMIHGIKIVRGASSVSYLFFVDDSLFFSCNALISQVKEIEDILEEYWLIFEQLVHCDNSTAYFSKGTCGPRILYLNKHPKPEVWR